MTYFNVLKDGSIVSYLFLSLWPSSWAGLSSTRILTIRWTSWTIARTLLRTWCCITWSVIRMKFRKFWYCFSVYNQRKNISCLNSNSALKNLNLFSMFCSNACFTTCTSKAHLTTEWASIHNGPPPQFSPALTLAELWYHLNRYRSM